MLCFGTPVWADRIRRGGDAGMAGGSLLVAIGEQGLNSLAVAVSFGDEGTLVGGLFAGELGAAGGAGGSAKLGTKAGAAALGTKALAEACVVLSLARCLVSSPSVDSGWRPSRARVASALGVAQRGPARRGGGERQRLQRCAAWHRAFNLNTTCFCLVALRRAFRVLAAFTSVMAAGTVTIGGAAGHIL